ncbi:MAG: helix-turn-helix domain-containing protein [Planctomycetota bacterium]|jgi:transcriptional regulator with XRE-family HTH domain
MSDNLLVDQPAPIGQQIRRLRRGRAWTLAELARRAETSAPTLHRYENGWDRFELATLRKIATALGARLEVRLVPRTGKGNVGSRLPWKSLAKLLSPLFWDQDLSDKQEHRDWVLGRVLVFGNGQQVAAARSYFGDEAIRRAVERRGVDARTRNYWKLILAGAHDASEGAGR